MHYDFDKTGVCAATTTQNYTGSYISMDDTVTNNSAADTLVRMVGQVIDVASSNTAGDIKNFGLRLDVKGGDKNYGIEITAGNHLVMYNPDNTADSGEIKVGPEGEMTIQTTDADTKKANLILKPDGAVIIETSSAPAIGGGIDQTPSSHPIITVAKVNEETVTTILWDIGGGDIVSSAHAGDVIGNDDVADAFVMQIQKDDHGLIYKAELICVEAPTTGDPDLNVCLNSDGTIAEDASGEGQHVIINGGTQTVGKFTEHDASAIAAAAGGHGDFLYITHGGTTAGLYNNGKIVIKLYY